MEAADGERRGAGRYFQALREHWPFILATVVLAVGAAVAYSLLAPKRYDAEADILVTPVSAADETFAGLPVLRETPEARSVLTVSRLLKTPQVADAVKEKLGTAMDRNELLDAIEVRPQQQSNVLTVRASGDKPDEAASIANAFADVFLARRTAAFQQALQPVLHRLDRRLRAVSTQNEAFAEAAALATRVSQLRGLLGLQDPTLQVANRAVAPESAAWPRPALSIAVALLAGGLLGMGVAVGLEILDPLVLREDDLVSDHRFPVLARLPRLRADAVRRYARKGELPADVVAAYRMLRANLARIPSDGGLPPTILVTSASRGDGKSVTAATLSLSLAQAGVRVTLVDADLRRPGMATLLGVTAREPLGIADLLSGDASPEQALVELPQDGAPIRLLMPTQTDGDLVDLLAPDQARHLVNELMLDAEVVVIDAPPAAEVAEALALAAAVDVVLVAVRLGRTRRDKVSDLIRVLGQHDLTPAGFVTITRTRPRRSSWKATRVRSQAGERAAIPVDRYR